MAGKTINTNGNGSGKVATGIDNLRALITKRYTGVPFEVPGYDGELVVEVAMLKRAERETIVEAVSRPDGSWDNLLQNRMTVAYGLINPKLVDLPYDDPTDKKVHERFVAATTEALLEYPDSFIDPIAKKIWDMSNEYREDSADRRGGAESRPFQKMSGSPSGSSIEPE